MSPQPDPEMRIDYVVQGEPVPNRLAAIEQALAYVNGTRTGRISIAGGPVYPELHQQERSVSMPVRPATLLSPKRRLIKTFLRPDAIRHLVSLINTPGTTFATSASRWLDKWETVQPAPEMKVVRGDLFTAYYDRVVCVSDRAAQLADVPYITSTGTLIYNVAACTHEPPCDAIVNLHRDFMSPPDIDSYVCVRVDVDPEMSTATAQTIKDALLGTWYWAAYLDAYAALPAIHQPYQIALLTMPNKIIYGQPQQVWLAHTTELIMSRLEETIRGLCTDPEYVTRILTVGPDDTWPLRGTVREMLQRVFADIAVDDPDVTEATVVTSNEMLDIPLEYNPDHAGWSTLHAGSEQSSGGAFNKAIQLLTTQMVASIRTGIELKLTSVNLIARSIGEVFDDPDITMFDEPVANLLERIANGPDLVAAALLKATAMVYGFERIKGKNRDRTGWAKVRTDDTGKSHSAAIWDNGQILIDDQPICVVFTHGRHIVGSYTSVGLPYGDEIANRMWVMATNARDSITTFSPQHRQTLEMLFAKREIVDKTIDDLAAEIHQSMIIASKKGSK